MSLANPAALVAFLQGMEPRAWVFARHQCGDASGAGATVVAALARFVAEAPALPLARWPLHWWQCLLGQPPVLAGADAGAEAPLARLPPGPRAALLLRLVAGLDIAPAARALQVSITAYEAALRQATDHPALAGPALEALRERLGAEVHALAPEHRQALARWREQALAARATAPPPAAFLKRERPRRWPWAVLAVLLLALAATEFWPMPRLMAPGAREALPPEAIAAVPLLTEPVIVTHPDYAQLAAPGDDALAQQLAFLSWLAADAAPAGLPDLLPPPATAPDQIPAADRELLAAAATAWPLLDVDSRAALLANAADWRGRSSAERAALRQRMRAWDRQPATQRARQRTPFLAWQALGAGGQARVRAAADQLRQLPPDEQRALRARFQELPSDSQRLWWMGPELGRELVPVAPLFAFLPEAERPALLAALRRLEPTARDDLALVASRLGEARREQLRRELLAAPPEQRAALIREQLAR